MNKFLSKCKAPIEIIRIITQYEPMYGVYALPQTIVNAVLPILAVYFPKIILEQLTGASSFGDIAKTIAVFAWVLLLMHGANIFLQNKSDIHAAIFSSKLKNNVGKLAMGLDLADIESPKSGEWIRMASRAADLTEVAGIVQAITANAITIIGLAYIISRLDWLFILLVAMTLTVKTVFVYMQYSHEKILRRKEAENDKFGNYLHHISYGSEGGAKEIRLNSLQEWYMEKVTAFRNTMLRMQYGNFKRNAAYNSIMAILLALQSLIILWVLTEKYIQYRISIADFTLYFTTAVLLTERLSAISDQLQNYSRQVLHAKDYQNFVSLTHGPERDKTAGSAAFSMPEKTEIVFENVSFAYPNTGRQVLNRVNITVKDKEKLVIVGANGAGKSTFIKLLCKFYRPTEGKITLNGTDIWNIPNEIYYTILAAVFQDFTNLSFTLSENIAMAEDGDREKIAHILSNIGLQERVDELPDGYDTYLTRSFSAGGIELSGGQAQKIAIARAVYKDAPVLILDEPTANLDPKAESEIYTEFFHMAKEKTAIFISHRLAASTIADNIAVFDHGAIVEYGTHDELIRRRGIYAGMYRKQSAQYVGAIGEFGAIF